MKKSLRKILVLLTVLSFVLLPGCKAKQAENKELMVSVAASLTDCIQEIGKAFQDENPGVEITFNFGSSGALQQQIEQGAPADIFFSAGKKQMAALEEAGLVAEDSVKEVLENKIVIVVPKGGASVESFEALTSEAVEKIGVGDFGSVPVGQYTEEVFNSLNIMDAVEPKLVFAKDVREVLSWVETGNVDAGIVYETDAKISDKVEVCSTAPPGTHKPIIYPVGIVKSSTEQELAQTFIDYLAGDTARELFIQYGFSPLD